MFLHIENLQNMKLQRISSMGFGELVFRTRQELAKRLERTGVGVPGRIRSRPALRIFALRGAGRRGGRLNYGNAVRPHEVLFNLLYNVRFFRGAVSTRTRSVFKSRMPDAYRQVLEAADDACRGRFNLLGYSRLSFGNPPDWHLDPVSGRHAPDEHWSRIDPLDPERVGDSRVIWELSRHQWFVSLGQAYRCTGEEHYARRFAGSITGWMQANPVGRGINWTSSLEAAFRLISWSWALFLFRGSKVLPWSLSEAILEQAGVHARRIERYLSYYFSPNTHLTGEALGLFYAGTVFPELDGADRWRELGRRILLEQLDRQVLPDGVYFEQSTCYQRYTVEIYLHFLILAARQGVVVPPEVGERVQDMLDFLLAIRQPDGSMPQIGDTDGGSLLPLAHRTSEDFRGVFAVAAAFFGRADYAWAAGEAAPEVLWLLGPEGLQVFDALQPSPPSTTPSRLFERGGYAVMRESWDRDAHQLILDAGPLGCPVSSGHGHADLLAIQCAVFGEPCLIDPGTYGYTHDRRWRDYFRGSFAHSTVTIDGLGQADPGGPFKWGQRPRARLRRWVSTETFDLVDADHDAYHRLADPVTHRRRVLFVKPRYWVVVDDLYGQDEHRVGLRFQLAPMTAITPGADGWGIARGSRGRGCRFRVCSPVPLDVELAAGQEHPIRGWVSPDYGRREPAPLVIYSAVARFPLRLVTLLVPTGDPAAAPPEVTESCANRRIDMVCGNTTETIHIDEEDIVLERKVPAHL